MSPHRTLKVTHGGCWAFSEALQAVSVPAVAFLAVAGITGKSWQDGEGGGI